MAKKDYESPKMKEVKISVEQELLSGSCATYAAGGSGCSPDE